MTPEDLEALFTRPDGSYMFARWARPLTPVLFGVQDKTIAVFRTATQQVADLAGVQLSQVDTELGANLMFFFFREWEELRAAPNIDQLIPDMDALIDRLEQADATQYRLFRFDGDGAIRACFVFLRMAGSAAQVPAETLALDQMVRAILLWSDGAFADRSPLAAVGRDDVVIQPDIAAVIRAAYDPVLPDAADDRAHALRLSARLPAGLSASPPAQPPRQEG